LTWHNRQLPGTINAQMQSKQPTPLPGSMTPSHVPHPTSLLAKGNQVRRIHLADL